MRRSLKSKARHRGFDLHSTKQSPEQNFEEGEEFSYMDIGEERCSKIQERILEKESYLLKTLFPLQKSNLPRM